MLNCVIFGQYQFASCDRPGICLLLNGLDTLLLYFRNLKVDIDLRIMDRSDVWCRLDVHGLIETFELG